jgi:hypothetical protein
LSKAFFSPLPPYFEKALDLLVISVFSTYNDTGEVFAALKSLYNVPGIKTGAL